MRMTVPPDTCRIVRCFPRNGDVVLGFYWRPEKLWYAAVGSKKKKDALDVVDWREINQALAPR